MQRKWRLIFRLTAVLLTACMTIVPRLLGQEYNSNGPLPLVRLKGEVKLDGPSDEPAWQGIAPLPMSVLLPTFGIPCSERTEILVGYDDNFFYVAGRLYDSEAHKIKSTSKKRDASNMNQELLAVLLDSYHDHENALAFFTNPSGARSDFAFFNDSQPGLPPNSDPFNVNWNTFWDVATKVNDQGWFVEMRIPFSSLRFQERDGRVVMGLIVWRWVARNFEVQIFPAIPPNWGMYSMNKPSQAREVVLEGVRSRKPLYIAPYGLAGFSRDYELNETETAYGRQDTPQVEAGLDIKYGLTNNLTMDLTVNTDFAQVEADDVQINLTRFSLFFPEKRLFFQERSSSFDFLFGGDSRLFYSRRIGITDDKPVRIYGGLRLVGRAGPFDLGLISMQTARLEEEALPSQNFTVLRARRQVFNPYSYVGGMVTSILGADGSYNTAYGLDGIFRVFGDDYFKFNWAQTFETGRANRPLSLDPSRFTLNWEKRSQKGFGYNFSLSWCGRDYDPAMGFESREDFRAVKGKLWHTWLAGEKSAFIRQTPSLSYLALVRNSDGRLESAEIGPAWDFELKSGMMGNLTFKAYYEDLRESFELSDDVEVPPGRYSFAGLDGWVYTPMTKPLYSLIFFNAGSFYDGRRVSLGAQPTWGLSSSLELSGYLQFNRVVFPSRDRELTGTIVRLRGLFMMSVKLTASAFIQYNSLDRAVIANVRLRYNPREGVDFYIVYNENFNTGRNREVPALPLSSSRAIMVKYTYTFNL
ncbi:MAG TPA: DUF5916 domain-containing protein [Acidobacteriota bacterium]